MHWLSSPKVRLALIVNGLYFISLFVPPSPAVRPNFFAQARESLAGRRASVVPPEYIPPPSGPSRASAFESGGLLHVSLNKDLTLIQRPGRTLVLSPSFSARAIPPSQPKSALLNLILYTDSGEEACPDNCPFIIKADAEVIWPERSAVDSGGYSYSWKRESVPHSSSTLEDGRVVETLAAESFSAEVPYNTFLDIISARRVVFRLGSDWVELDEEQVEALRDMHRRLPPPPTPDYSYPY